MNKEHLNDIAFVEFCDCNWLKSLNNLSLLPLSSLFYFNNLNLTNWKYIQPTYSNANWGGLYNLK